MINLVNHLEKSHVEEMLDCPQNGEILTYLLAYWILATEHTTANEVTALQTTRANLAVKEAALLEAVIAKAALLSNSSLR